jgi:hypothetical protein
MIDDVLKKMSLQQKIGQMLLVRMMPPMQRTLWCAEQLSDPALSHLCSLHSWKL